MSIATPSSRPTAFESETLAPGPTLAAGVADRRPWFRHATVFHALALVLFALSWLVDVPFAQACDRWYNGEKINGELHQLIISLAQYGQPIGTLVVVSLIGIFDRGHANRILALLIVLSLTGLGSSVFKFIAGRERPRDSACVSIFHGPLRNWGDSKTASFPSGHTATAFAMSYTIATYYPPARILAWSMAGGVAVNRVVTVRHFASDCVVGAWFGLVMAALLLRGQWVESTSHAILRRLSRVRLTYQLDRARLINGVERLARSPWLLAAACLLMYWAGNGSLSLWDRDEPRFATATREMIARQDWIVPTFNGELRPDKPIFIYWLQRVAYALLGDGPFAARFWSGVGGMVASLLTYRLACQMFDRRVGLLAGWMLALSPMLIVESKLATVDAVLLATIMLAMNALWSLQSGDARRSVTFVFWFALGLGILTKGPVALVVPAVTTLIFSLVRGHFAWIGAWNWLAGVGMMLAIVLPWVVAVQWATAGEFLSASVGHHVVARSLTPLENHAGFPGYYLVSVMLLMVPWSFLLPWAIYDHRRRIGSDARVAFLIAWSVGTLIVFELIRTKLVHYYLPAYPALAILLSSALVGSFHGIRPGIERLPWRRLSWVVAAMGVSLILVVAGLSIQRLPQSIGEAAVLTACVAGLGLIVSAVLIRERRLRLALGCHCAMAVTVIIACGVAVLPAVHRSQVIVSVAEALRRHGEKKTIAFYEYRDPSLIYNVARIVPLIDLGRTEGQFEGARQLASEKGAFLCPLTEEMMGRMKKDSGLSLSVVETIEHWDINGLKPRKVHITEVRPSVLSKSKKEPPR